MAIKTNALPQVNIFGSENEFLVNGANGTGRMTGEVAGNFFGDYFEYPLYNYEGADLEVKYASEITNYSSVWAWLKARLTANDMTGIHIKDFVSFTTRNSVTLKARIADINHDLGFNDTEITKWHIDFICDELWPDLHVWNNVNYNNGIADEASPWLASDLYHFLNSLSGNVPNGTGADPATVAVDYTSSGVYDKLPDALKAVIVERRNWEPTRYTAGQLLTDDASATWLNIGKLWVPNEVEVYNSVVWGTRNGYNFGASHIFPIFRDGKMRLKKRSGSRGNWWLRTARSGDHTHAALIYFHGVANYGNAGNTGISVPVCFRISA